MLQTLNDLDGRSLETMARQQQLADHLASLDSVLADQIKTLLAVVEHQRTSSHLATEPTQVAADNQMSADMKMAQGVQKAEDALSAMSRMKLEMESASQDLHERQAALKELKTQLEASEKRHTTLQFNTSDDSGDFECSITILHQKHVDDDVGHTQARATLDSGCDDNWVSMSVISRARLEDHISELEHQNIFKSFSGHLMQPLGFIQLTWFMTHVNKRLTRQDAFYVYDKLPVDLILGKQFIQHEFMLVSRMGLGLIKQGKFTPGKDPCPAMRR